VAKKRSAKGQFVASRKKSKAAEETTPAASLKKKRKRAYRRNDDAPGAALLAPTANPALQDIAEFVIPGFVGYGVTKFASRIAYTQLMKRFPTASKHMAAGSTLAVAAAVWFLANKVQRTKKYHIPATVGASIAALQTLIQTYLPKYGWMVSDLQATSSAPLLTTSTGVGPAATLNAQSQLSGDVERLFPGGPEIANDLSDDGADGLGDVGDSFDMAAMGLGLGSLGSEGVVATEFTDMN